MVDEPWYWLLIGWIFMFSDVQTLDNRGTSFLLPFMPNGNESANILLVVTSQYNANIFVNNPNAREEDRHQKYKVQAEESLSIKLEGKVAVSTNLLAEKKAVILLASQPVAVYAFSLETRSSDGYLALPVNTLGTRYVVATYAILNIGEGQFAVAAIENDTDITITMRVQSSISCGDVNLTSDNMLLYFRLQSQEVVRIFCDGDFTGSIVNSTKAVAVVAGNICAEVPPLYQFCDHLVEMMVPVTALGTRYLLHSFGGRDNGAFYYVVPSQSGTHLSFGDSVRSMDSPFELFLLNQNSTFYISADKPVMVVGYAKGHSVPENATHKGDPFMVLLPPPDLAPADFLLDFATLSNYSNPNLTCYVTAVVNDAFSQGVHIGEEEMSLESASDGFSIGTQEIRSWPAHVYHDNFNASVAVVAYCFAYDVGIGLPAGYTLGDFTGVDECASSPCQHDGLCYSTGDAYRCHCHGIYSGQNCEQEATTTHVAESTESATELTSTESTTELTSTESTTELTTTPAVQTTEPTTESSTHPVAKTSQLPPTNRSAGTTTLSPSPQLNKLCPCSCGHVQLDSPAQENVTAKEQQEEILLKIKEELEVYRKNTSKVRHRLHSAVDTRISAAGLGIVSMFLLALVVGFVIAMDATTFIHKVRRPREKAPGKEKPKSTGNKNMVDHFPEDPKPPLLSHASAVRSLGHDVRSDAAVAGGNWLPGYPSSKLKHLIRVPPEAMPFHVNRAQSHEY